MATEGESIDLVKSLGMCGTVVKNGTHICILKPGHPPTVDCPPTADVRQRIIIAGDAQFDAHEHYDVGVPAISVAAAREALRIAKERLECHVVTLSVNSGDRDVAIGVGIGIKAIDRLCQEIDL